MSLFLGRSSFSHVLPTFFYMISYWLLYIYYCRILCLVISINLCWKTHSVSIQFGTIQQCGLSEFPFHIPFFRSVRNRVVFFQLAQNTNYVGWIRCSLVSSSMKIVHAGSCCFRNHPFRETNRGAPFFVLLNVLRVFKPCKAVLIL